MSNLIKKYPNVEMNSLVKNQTAKKIQLLVIAALCLTAMRSPGQINGSSIITNIAGTGTAGYTGDHGQATAAELSHPANVVTDSNGNIYFSDYGNYRVRKISNTGIITTIGGNGTSASTGDNGPATDAGIFIPGGIVVKGTDVYIGETQAGRVRRITASGYIIPVAGAGGLSFSGDGGPATDAHLNNPQGMLIDHAGNLLIVDGGNRRIRLVTPAGIISTFAGNGGTGSTGNGGPATNATFTYPTDLAEDADGNIYITDDGANVIRVVNPAGIISAYAGTGAASFGGDGGAATAASFNQPASITIDRFGNMYVSEYNTSTYNDNRVRKINTSGIISTICGTSTAGVSGDGGPAYAALLNLPSKVCADLSGNVFVVNANGNKIRVINLSPIKFAAGHTAMDSVCNNELALSVNTSLTVIDSNINRPVTWSLLSGPSHGIATISCTLTSTGSPLTPTGSFYTPAAGYVGNDTFKVRVTDTYASDTLAVYMNVKAPPAAITGSGLVIAGFSVTLADATPGGTWSSSNTTAGTINPATGVFTGIATGIDTIIYTSANGCSVTKTITVNPMGTSVKMLKVQGSVSLYPNPAHENLVISADGVDNGSAAIKIFDQLGKVVLSETTTIAGHTLQKQVSLSGLPDAVYIVALTDANGNTLRAKFVKQ